MTPNKPAQVLAGLIFGIILPGYLVWLLLFSHFSLQHETERDNALRLLGQALDKVDEFSKDPVFFHSLFQKNFRRADQAEKPIKSLKKTIKWLSQNFDRKISFIVFDSAGKTIPELTNEKKFKYVLRSMFEIIHLLKDSFTESSFTNPACLEKVLQKIKLLRSYFGELLSTSELFEPLRDGSLGRALFVSDKPEKAMLWFYPGLNFSIVCSINASLLKRNIGTETIINHHNKHNKNVKLAAIKTISYETIGFPKEIHLNNQLLIEAKSFESSAEAERSSRDLFAIFRQISHDLIILSFVKKTAISCPEEKTVGFFLRAIRWFILFAFLVFCASLRHKEIYPSVQKRIILLFLFANGLPFLVLLSTGYEFFNEKKKELISSAHHESIRILKEFDLRFPEVTDKIAESLNSFINERNQIHSANKWPETDINDLRELIKGKSPLEAVLYQNDKSMAFYYSATSAMMAEKLIEEILERALWFFNKDENKKAEKSNSMIDKVATDGEILHFFLKMLDRFTLVSVGNNQRHTFTKFLGDRQQGIFWGVLAVGWSRSQLLNSSIKERIVKAENKLLPRQLVILDQDTEMVYSSRISINRNIRRLLRQAIKSKIVTEQNVELNGQRYILSAIVGNEMPGSVIAALYPQKNIENEIYFFKLYSALIAAIVLLILTNVARMFSTRLLVPIIGLKNGISSIKNGDLNASIDFHSKDELGNLIKAFNNTARNMKELAIGTAVQESLLPPSCFSHGSFDIFARSVFMTKMGGDYFDYFIFPDGRLGVFFGDVAGHGIPAAMIMAMAKAVVTGLDETCRGPADLLDLANQVLLQLKKRKWRRMMTAQAISFDEATGEVRIANAGQCYPMIVNKTGEIVTQVKATGMPLGSSSKKNYKEEVYRIHPGETMVLYTDGVIEAVNTQGEQFDFDRFEKLIGTSWSDNLTKYWENILAGARNWNPEQDDDLTFMLIRYIEKSA